MPASTTEDVQAAVVGVVTALGLTPAPRVVGRKRAALLDGETPPLVLVAAATVDPPELVWKGTWLVPYAVSVGVVLTNTGAVGDSPTARSWLDQVWVALADWQASLTALADVDHTEPRAQSLFDPAGLAATLDWAAVDLSVVCLQPRY